VVNLKPRLIQFTNTDNLLVPYGKIEFPEDGNEMRGNCNLADPARRYSVISGYALDVGLSEEDRGIGYVELMIDRALYANTDLDCHHNPNTGGLTDCYGIRRLDLQNIYPIVKDDPHVGFRFVLDVGALLADPDGSGGPLYLPGHHLITIRAGDNADQISNVHEFHVTFSCDEFTGNEDSKGTIVQPRPGNMQAGQVVVSGWAIDWEGVSHVRLLVDGQYHAAAPYGFVVPGLDLNFYYPGYPNVAAPGWIALLDTTQFANGPHEIGVIVVDQHGRETFIGKQRLVFANPGF
jgi:hypothetical protein